MSRPISKLARPHPSLAVAGLAVALLAVGPAFGDDIDHEEARALVEQGRILPLSEIIARIRAKVPGEVLEVEFEREHGVYVYELNILRPDGKVQEVEVNAATGQIVDIEDDD